MKEEALQKITAGLVFVVCQWKTGVCKSRSHSARVFLLWSCIIPVHDVAQSFKHLEFLIASRNNAGFLREGIFSAASNFNESVNKFFGNAIAPSVFKEQEDFAVHVSATVEHVNASEAVISAFENSGKVHDDNFQPFAVARDEEGVNDVGAGVSNETLFLFDVERVKILDGD